MKIDRVDIQVKYCGNEVKRKVRKSIIELDTLSWNTRKIAVDKSKYVVLMLKAITSDLGVSASKRLKKEKEKLKKYIIYQKPLH